MEKEKINALEMENKELKAENVGLKEELEELKLQVASFQKMIFGPRSEKTSKKENLVEGEQSSLFDEEFKELSEKIQGQINKDIEEVTVGDKQNKKKKKREKISGIKRGQLKNTKIEVKRYELNKEVKCPECGGDFKQIGEEVVRKEIVYTPATFKIVEFVQYTYKCENCGKDESNKETPTIVKTEIPKPVLTHSFVSASLATEVLYQKYYLGVPFYRQEKMWDDKGLVLPRNMMANWSIKIDEYYFRRLCELQYKKMKEESELLHYDETTMQCNKEPGRKASSNSYMWVARTGELEKKQGIYYMYSKSRSEETAKEFIKGYTGIIETDGYAGYNNIEGVIHAKCWAHARRYFYQSIPLDENKQLKIDTYGYIGLTYCNKLFKIEEKIANLSVVEKKEKRQILSKPIIEEFYNWVNSVMDSKIILNKKLEKALTYVTNQRKGLTEFLNDGRIPISNNLVETSIRPFAIHRKNWLFADTIAGAKANATMYTIIETAKINKLNISKYINYLLEELPQLDDINDEKELAKYLPWSEELPEEIRNYEGEYKELMIN